MLHDHLTLVRKAYDAYNRRDAAALQGLCHEQCTIYTVLEGQSGPSRFAAVTGFVSGSTTRTRSGSR